MSHRASNLSELECRVVLWPAGLSYTRQLTRVEESQLFVQSIALAIGVHSPGTIVRRRSSSFLATQRPERVLGRGEPPVKGRRSCRASGGKRWFIVARVSSQWVKAIHHVSLLVSLSFAFLISLGRIGNVFELEFSELPQFEQHALHVH
jgi:hypothetical protein